jgi:hypothetical protein
MADLSMRSAYFMDTVWIHDGHSLIMMDIPFRIKISTIKNIIILNVC